MMTAAATRAAPRTVVMMMAPATMGAPMKVAMTKAVTTKAAPRKVTPMMVVMTKATMMKATSSPTTAPATVVLTVAARSRALMILGRNLSNCPKWGHMLAQVILGLTPFDLKLTAAIVPFAPIKGKAPILPLSFPANPTL